MHKKKRKKMEKYCFRIKKVQFLTRNGCYVNINNEIMHLLFVHNSSFSYICFSTILIQKSYQNNLSQLFFIFEYFCMKQTCFFEQSIQSIKILLQITFEWHITVPFSSIFLFFIKNDEKSTTFLIILCIFGKYLRFFY